MRDLSTLDQLITGFDRALRTVSPGSTKADRSSPALPIAETNDKPSLSESDKRHIGGLMRINHTGEVCAQALYQGQALTAEDPTVRQSMQVSAREEEDHLAWCEERLVQLDSRTSYLNPLFYSLSFSLGALAGIAGDKWSLGFVAATEDQVCTHLRDHLDQVPESDQKTRAILNQMLEDEQHHGTKALDAGGVEFHGTAKKLMTAISKVMTKTTYKI